MKPGCATRRLASMARKALGIMMVLTAGAGVAAAVPPLQTPEIDPTSIAGAMALFIGGAMMLKDRILKS